MTTNSPKSFSLYVQPKDEPRLAFYSENEAPITDFAKLELGRYVLQIF